MTDERQAGFSTVPTWLLRDERVSRYAVLVYVVLSSYAGMVSIYPSHETIAKQAGCSERKVRSALTELRDLGLVEWVQTKTRLGRGPNVYRLTSGRLEVPAHGAGTPGGTGTSEHEVPAPGAGEVDTSQVEREARKRAPSRATQIQDSGFTVTPDMRTWAATNAPAVPVDAETEKFVDYWVGVGKPMKNWEATWRNRMRSAQERLGGVLPAAVSAPAPVVDEEESKRRWCEQHGVTPEQWDEHERAGDAAWLRDVVDGKMVDRRG